MTTCTTLPVDVVRESLDAFNARDVDAFMNTLTETVDFRPIRLVGVDGRPYHGQDAVRDWFGRVQELPHRYTIAADAVEQLADNKVAVSGAMTLSDGHVITPFWGTYLMRADLIDGVRQYFTDPAMAQNLGLSSWPR